MRVGSEIWLDSSNENALSVQKMAQDPYQTCQKMPVVEEIWPGIPNEFGVHFFFLFRLKIVFAPKKKIVRASAQSCPHPPNRRGYPGPPSRAIPRRSYRVGRQHKNYVVFYPLFTLFRPG